MSHSMKIVFFLHEKALFLCIKISEKFVLHRRQIHRKIIFLGRLAPDSRGRYDTSERRESTTFTSNY